MYIDFIGLSENITSREESAVATFWATFGNIQTTFLTSGHWL